MSSSSSDRPQSAPPPGQSAFFRLWHKIPGKTTLFLIALLFLIKEFYPFSHFPMYSKFATSPFYVYVTDAEGTPIPVETLTGLRTSILKKRYDGNLRQIKKATGTPLSQMTPEQKEPAGKDVLSYFAAQPPLSGARPIPADLRLYEVRLTLEEGQIARRIQHVATYHPHDDKL